MSASQTSFGVTIWKKMFQTAEKLRNYQARQCRHNPHKEITMTQVQIIGCVLFAPEHRMRVRDISDELGITPGAVSQQVEKLVRMNLLERRIDEHDRRAVSITLSEHGKEINRELDESFSRIFSALLENVPEEKIQIFADILEIMLDGLVHKKGLTI